MFYLYLNSYFNFDYVQPALQTGNAYFNDRPILTVCLPLLLSCFMLIPSKTFSAIFLALSVLPVLAFL